MSHLFVLCELLFLCSFFSQVAAACLFLGAMLYQTVDYFLYSKLQIRLRPSLFVFLARPASFGSSAKKLGAFRFFGFAGVFIGVFLAIFLLCKPSLKAVHPGLFFCLGALCFPRKREAFANPLYLIQRDFLLSIGKRFKKAAPLAGFAFSGESARFLTSEYPLLRITEKFLGDPLFDLRIEKNEKPHILFIFMESFRAKNCGSLGASVPLSPQFDALASKGILFSNFHSTGTLTSRATIASLFGVPPAHTWWHPNRYAEIPLAGLPQALAAEGYVPALIEGGAVSFDYGIEFFGAQGYQTMLGSREIRRDAGEGSTWGVFDEHLMPYAASWLAKQTTPSFLSLFTITNHHPWIHPQGWNPPAGTGNHPYLNTYAYSDEALGLLLNELKEKKLLEKSILFIFGDHGQETPAGNPYSGSNRHLKQENVHVPLLIYAEGRIDAPKVIDTLSSQVDLVPTVFDLLQLKQPHHSLGKSLVRSSQDPIFFSHPYDSVIQGCRKGNWKFLIDERGEELFDLTADPAEKENLREVHPAIAQELKEATLSYTATVTALYEKRRWAPHGKMGENRYGPQVLRLDFSGDLRLSDADLINIAAACPNLAKISLAGCRLLTDVGLKGLLQSCPHLEVLHIEGLDEVTGEGFAPSTKLTELHALSCHRFSGWRWLMQLYSLRDLHLETALVHDAQLVALAESHSNLRALTLRGMSELKDEGLKAFFHSNPYIKIISLQNCPQITDDAIVTLEQSAFRYVEIIDCPKVTRRGIESLASQPQRVIRYQSLF